ncbi:SIS domain-containing protein [Litorivicinus lipolyticus]|uniref:SIS domain-containing protein n=1 Tax=Litorivicinus lipolyticus TaxID=418701 RepID=UPI003B5B4AEE
MTTNLFKEIHQIPAAAARGALYSMPQLPAVSHVYTLARGSSDHAAQVLNRLIGRHLGLPASALAPGQVDGLTFSQSLVIAISQSGASPDLVKAVGAARAGGASTLGLINQANSALHPQCDQVVPLLAGPELSVAATKSFFQSVLMGYRLINPGYQPPLLSAPTLDLALQQFLVEQPILTVLGRGETLGLAREVALKIQELLGKPAFAYSSAEVVHGPKAMVMESSAILVLAGGSYRDELIRTGAQWQAWGRPVQTRLSELGVLDALYDMPTIYLALEAACRALGRPVDAPIGLKKVTLTR